MTIHNFEPLDDMMQVLDIIQSEGVDLHRVVMSHTGAAQGQRRGRLHLYRRRHSTGTARTAQAQAGMTAAYPNLRAD